MGVSRKQSSPNPRGKKFCFFGKFGVLCFHETPVFRFALLPYYRQFISDKLIPDSVLLSVFYWLTLNCRRKTKLALGTVQTVLTQIFINWLMSSSIYTNTCIWSLSRPCTFPFSSDSARTLQKEWRKKHLIHAHQDKLARINFKSKHSSAINPVQH